MRSCYCCNVRFFRDDPTKLVRIRWYFVDDTIQHVPYVHPFYPRNWDIRNGEQEPTLGEVYAGRRYSKGKAPFKFNAPGLCGTAEQWQNGALTTDPLPGRWPGTNVPGCCPPPAFDPFAAREPLCSCLDAFSGACCEDSDGFPC